MEDENIGICNQCGIEAELDIDTGMCATCLDDFLRGQEGTE